MNAHQWGENGKFNSFHYYGLIPGNYKYKMLLRVGNQNEQMIMSVVKKRNHSKSTQLERFFLFKLVFASVGGRKEHVKKYV